MEEDKISIGLLPLPEDSRDFQLGAFFDLGRLEDVPDEDFEIDDEFPVKDQLGTDFCTGYAVTDASSAQEQVSLSPEYQFGATKALTGNLDAWGADLRMACQSAVTYGSIPQEMWDKHFGEEERYHRELVADKSKFPIEWDVVAKTYKKGSFFAVDSNSEYDTFDNIRLALWHFKNKKCKVVTGAQWRTSWTRAKGGVVKISGDKKGNGHAFVIKGQKMINGVPYLKLKLSNGTNIGDKGIFYFHRSVINKELGRFGIFMFNDLEKETVKVLNKWEMNVNPITKFFAELAVLLFKKYGRG